MYKSWSPWVWRDHTTETIFTCRLYIEKKCAEPAGQFKLNLVKIILLKRNHNCSNERQGNRQTPGGFNLWSLGVGKATMGTTFLNLFKWRKSFKIFFSKNHLAKKLQIHLQGYLMQNLVVKGKFPERLGPH
jgi:hypothetical protein